MAFPCKRMAAAALGALLAGCGGPPDDVVEAARQARAAVAATAPGVTSPALDRGTAVMGAGPAPAQAAAAAKAAASSPVDDALITSRVRGVLDADREIGALRVDVDTREGVVTLSGTVPSAASRARAGDLAKSVKDVKSVNDQLTLSRG